MNDWTDGEQFVAGFCMLVVVVLLQKLLGMDTTLYIWANKVKSYTGLTIQQHLRWRQASGGVRRGAVPHQETGQLCFHGTIIHAFHSSFD